MSSMRSPFSEVSSLTKALGYAGQRPCPSSAKVMSLGNQLAFLFCRHGFNFRLANKCFRAAVAVLLVDQFYRQVGAGVFGSFAIFMHFESSEHILGDSCIECLVVADLGAAAGEDVDRIVFSSFAGLIFFHAFEHALVAFFFLLDFFGCSSTH